MWCIALALQIRAVSLTHQAWDIKKDACTHTALHCICIALTPIVRRAVGLRLWGLWLCGSGLFQARSQAAKKPPTTLFLQAHSEFDEVVHSYSKEEKHKRCGILCKWAMMALWTSCKGSHNWDCNTDYGTGFFFLLIDAGISNNYSIQLRQHQQDCRLQEDGWC